MLTEFKKQKGISLYLALVIMTIFLSMGAGLGAILIKQKKSIQGISSSVASFYAADTGIEKAFYLDSIDEPTDSIEPDIGSEVRFKAMLENKCGLKIAVSHGHSDAFGVGARRSIEVSLGQDNSGIRLNEHNGSCDDICNALDCVCGSIGTNLAADDGTYYSLNYLGFPPVLPPENCRRIIGSCSTDLVEGLPMICLPPPAPCDPIPCPGPPPSPESEWTFCYCTSTSP